MVLCDEPSLTVSLTDTGYHLIMTIMEKKSIDICIHFLIEHKDILNRQKSAFPYLEASIEKCKLVTPGATPPPVTIPRVFLYD